MFIQTPTGGGGSMDPLSLLQYGVLGATLIAIIVGWLWPRPSVQQLIKDKERAEEQRDELMRTYEEKILPILSEYADASERQTAAVETVLRILKDADHERRRPGPE